MARPAIFLLSFAFCACASSPEQAVVATAPGDVAWEPDFAAALEVARESGRPALLVEVFGHLDEALC